MVLKVVAFVWILTIALYLAYLFFGDSFVRRIYEERSLSLLNGMMEGRESFPVDHYVSLFGGRVRASLLNLLLLTLPSVILAFWIDRSEITMLDFRGQVKKLSVLVLPLALALAALLVVAVYALYANAPPGDYVRDPAAIANGSPFVGAISNIGILLWCAVASVCFFCYRRVARHKRFLLASGLLTLMLLLDDLFMLHEYVFRVYLGMPEIATYSLYAIATTAYLFVFAKTIVRTEFSILFVAMAMFAASIYVDEILQRSVWTYFFEDSFKFVGIVAWATYFLRVCGRVMNEVAFNNADNTHS